MSLDVLIAQAEAWARDDPDPAAAAELRGLVERKAEAEVRDAFAGRLQFGTAGLRGVLGGGTNRMNRAVVRRTSLGFATLDEEHPKQGERREEQNPDIDKPAFGVLLAFLQLLLHVRVQLILHLDRRMLIAR